MAGFVDTLPDSEKARLTVSVKLLDKAFSYDLTDKSSEKYKELKTTVVEAVSVAFMLFVSFFMSGWVGVSERMCIMRHACLRMYKPIRQISMHVDGPVTLRRYMLLCHLKLNMRLHCYLDALI